MKVRQESFFEMREEDIMTELNSFNPPTDLTSWNLGKILLNEYIIESVLGTGGTGKVYLVRRQADGTMLALKILHEAALADERCRRMFLRELRTWIDLPDYPHLAACRFFRTIEGRLGIFNEYVSGGSLLSWIQNRKLLSVEKILDVAVQIAWGLQAAHDQQVIHQDVKPSNILMTLDGVAKVTDFGMARVENLPNPMPTNTPTDLHSLVTCSGMTPAYSSPEQIQEVKLSYKTDIWSYGLTILTAFTGGVTWPLGAAAREILQRVLSEDCSAPFPRLSEDIAGVLNSCFEIDVDQRCESLDLIAESFQKIYRDATGNDYPRTKPSMKSKRRSGSRARDRWVDEIIQWDDPADWIRKALRFAGKAYLQPEDPVSETPGSKVSDALAEFEMFNTALAIFQELVDKGELIYSQDVFNIMLNQALILGFVNDLPGAHAIYDKILNQVKHLPDDMKDIPMISLMSSAYNNKAKICFDTGDFNTALDLVKENIKLLTNFRKEHPESFTNRIATLAINITGLALRIGKLEESLEYSGKAVAMYSDLLKTGQDRKLYVLAMNMALNNRAAACRLLGKMDEAESCYRKAIDLLKSLQERDNRVLSKLALTASNYAIFCNHAGKLADSLFYYTAAIDCREEMEPETGFARSVDSLAVMYRGKSTVLASMGRYGEAVESAGKAAALFENLYQNEGRSDLVTDLGASYACMANAYSAAGRSDQADIQYGKAVALLESWYEQSKTTDLAVELGDVLNSWANHKNQMGTYPEALDLCQRANQLLTRIPATEYNDYKDELWFRNYYMEALIRINLKENATALDILKILILQLQSSLVKGENHAYQDILEDALKLSESCRDSVKDS